MISDWNKHWFILLAVIGILLIFGTAMPAMGAVSIPMVTYTVTPGDSLSTIAAKYGVKLSNLQQINALQQELIVPGEVLIIPNQNYLPESYTVQSGDSLYLIANKYGVSISSLMYLNNLTTTFILPGQVLVIPARPELIGEGHPLQEILKEKAITLPASFQIIIDKSAHILTLFSGNTLLKSYHVALGDNGPDDKEIAGDHKTPEGFFYIVDKLILNPADDFLGTRWMQLDYPTVEDAIRGMEQNLISNSSYQNIVTAFNNKSTPSQNTGLGGGIGIHGGDPGTDNDWTWGCIGLMNQDIEEFYPYIVVGTPVIIKK